MNLFDYQQLPGLDSLERYVQTGCPVGGFLSAVLCNDLVDACGKADMHNIEVIPVYAAWLYNVAPRDSWGSREKMEAWTKAGGLQGGA